MLSAVAAAAVGCSTNPRPLVSVRPRLGALDRRRSEDVSVVTQGGVLRHSTAALRRLDQPEIRRPGDDLRLSSAL